MQKSVQAVRDRGVKQTTQDIVKSQPAVKLRDFMQNQIEKGTNFTKKYLDQVIPGSSEKIEQEIKSYRESLGGKVPTCLLYTSPSPRDGLLSRMPSSA